MKLSMDITESGLRMFFKDWQIKALETLWKSSQPLNSREVWEAVNREISISRASIINFLEASHENGLLDRDSTTGKGGHRGLYSSKYDERGTKQYLKKSFKEHLEKL